MKSITDTLTIREYIDFLADELNDIMLMEQMELENQLMKITTEENK